MRARVRALKLAILSRWVSARSSTTAAQQTMASHGPQGGGWNTTAPSEKVPRLCTEPCRRLWEGLDGGFERRDGLCGIFTWTSLWLSPVPPGFQSGRAGGADVYDTTPQNRGERPPIFFAMGGQGRMQPRRTWRTIVLATKRVCMSSNSAPRTAGSRDAPAPIAPPDRHPSPLRTSTARGGSPRRISDEGDESDEAFLGYPPL